jgi:Domain of unknown function (DUF4276)
MVKVTIFFEGGANPKSNPNANTIDNTARLRESFNKLLNAGLSSEQIKIEAMPAYSISNSVKIRHPDSLLLIDLDGDKSLKEKRIIDSQLSDIREYVFFMVQRMEAWILSQPQVLEGTLKIHKIRGKSIVNDSSIHNKDPETIAKPDEILHTLLGRYFEITKNEKTRKMKYGKLKDAPKFLEKLDIEKLKKQFEDVAAIFTKIQSMI